MTASLLLPSHRLRAPPLRHVPCRTAPPGPPCLPLSRLSHVPRRSAPTANLPSFRSPGCPSARRCTAASRWSTPSTTSSAPARPSTSARWRRRGCAGPRWRPTRTRTRGAPSPRIAPTASPGCSAPTIRSGGWQRAGAELLLLSPAVPTYFSLRVAPCGAVIMVVTQGGGAAGVRPVSSPRGPLRALPGHPLRAGPGVPRQAGVLIAGGPRAVTTDRQSPGSCPRTPSPLAAGCCLPRVAAGGPTAVGSMVM